MEANKARNLIDHEAEILSRPAKTWIQTSKDKKQNTAEKINDNDGSTVGDGLSKRAKREEIKKKKMKKPETVRCRS